MCLKIYSTAMEDGTSEGTVSSPFHSQETELLSVLTVPGSHTAAPISLAVLDREKPAPSTLAGLPQPLHMHTRTRTHESPKDPAHPTVIWKKLRPGVLWEHRGADVPEATGGSTKNSTGGGAPDPGWGRPRTEAVLLVQILPCLFCGSGKCLGAEIMLLCGLN